MTTVAKNLIVNTPVKLRMLT